MADYFIECPKCNGAYVFRPDYKGTMVTIAGEAGVFTNAPIPPIPTCPKCGNSENCKYIVCVG